MDSLKHRHFLKSFRFDVNVSHFDYSISVFIRNDKPKYLKIISVVMNCGSIDGGHGSQLPFHFILVLSNQLGSILSISIDSRVQITNNFFKWAVTVCAVKSNRSWAAPAPPHGRPSSGMHCGQSHCVSRSSC